MSTPTRSFILHLLRNCPEAETGLRLWREGDLTFEEAMMEVAKELFLAKATLQRQYEWVPPAIRRSSLEAMKESDARWQQD